MSKHLATAPLAVAGAAQLGELVMATSAILAHKVLRKENHRKVAFFRHWDQVDLTSPHRYEDSHAEIAAAILQRYIAAKLVKSSWP